MMIVHELNKMLNDVALLEYPVASKSLTKIARVFLTIKLDSGWNIFLSANDTPPQGITSNVIAPAARIIARKTFKGP